MRIFLFITGLIFVIVGLRALIDPVHAVAEFFGFSVQGVNGMNQLRASAGGVAAACGAYMIAACFRPKWTYAALAVTALVLGGLVSGRIFSVIADGMPGTIVITSFALEFFGFVQAVYWLREHP